MLVLRGTGPDQAPTGMMVAAMSGTRRMVQGLVAVSPPSATLPEYAFNNGERVQAVGHQRNGNGEWTAAYVYGLASTARSMPDEEFGLKVRYAKSTDVDSVESGDFPDAPAITFEVKLANVAEVLVADLAEALEVIDWTSPTGLWAQSGPDIVRQRVYRLRPRRPSATGVVAEMDSGDACGLLEVCETRIAGQDGLFLYEGRWVNGAHDQDADPFSEDPKSDGEVYLQRLTVKLPAGFLAEIPDPHPWQKAGSHAELDLLIEDAGGRDFFFPTCSSYQFWFGIRSGGNATGATQAREYLRFQNMAWAAGPLGGTDQGICGDTADRALDFGKLGLQDQASPATGWEAIERIGETIATDFRAAWRAGAPTPDTDGDAGNRDGWFHPDRSNKGGPTGTSGLYQAAALVPTAGWLERMRYKHANVMGRSHFAARDIATGEAAWWYTTERLHEGEWKATNVGTPYKRPGVRKLWKFNGPEVTDGQLNHNPSSQGSLPADSYRVAPLTRPWNSPEHGDPAESQIRYYEMPELTHITMVRLAAQDLWYLGRSFLAFRDMEDVSAMISRTFPPSVNSLNPPNRWETNHTCTGFIARQRNPLYYGTGSNVVDGRISDYSNYRGLVWPARVLFGFYGIAPDGLREMMRGGGPAASRGGGDLLGELFDFLEFLTSPCGIGARSVRNGANPPYNEPAGADFGPYDPENRRGSLAFSGTVNDPESPAAILHFQQQYAMGMLRAATERVFGPGDPRHTALDRMFQYQRNLRDGLVAYGRDVQFNVQPYALVLSLGPESYNHPDSATPARVNSVEEVRAGAQVWNMYPGGDFTQPERGFSTHRWKPFQVAAYAAQKFGDDSYLDVARESWGLEGLTDQELLDYIVRRDGPLGAQSVEGEMASDESLPVVFGQWDWSIPFLVMLLDRIHAA